MSYKDLLSSIEEYGKTKEEKKKLRGKKMPDSDKKKENLVFDVKEYNESNDLLLGTELTKFDDLIFYNDSNNKNREDPNRDLISFKMKASVNEIKGIRSAIYKYRFKKRLKGVRQGTVICDMLNKFINNLNETKKE